VLCCFFEGKFCPEAEFVYACIGCPWPVATFNLATARRFFFARAFTNVDTSNVVVQLKPSTELAGNYAGPFNLISITPDGKNFHGEGLGMKVALRPEPDKWHSVKIKLGGLTIQADDLKSIRIARARIDGIDRQVGTDDGEPFLLGDLIEAYPASTQWDKLLGEYKVKNPVDVGGLNLKEVHLRGLRISITLK
jgi:hypothetical protein